MDELDRADERIVEMIDQPQDGRRFDTQHPLGLGDRGVILGSIHGAVALRKGHPGMVVKVSGRHKRPRTLAFAPHTSDNALLRARERESR